MRVRFNLSIKTRRGIAAFAASGRILLKATAGTDLLVGRRKRVRSGEDGWRNREAQDLLALGRALWAGLEHEDEAVREQDGTRGPIPAGRQGAGDVR